MPSTTRHAAIVALEEGASLAARLADLFEPEAGARLRAESRDRQAQAEAVRKVLQERHLFTLE